LFETLESDDVVPKKEWDMSYRAISVFGNYHFSDIFREDMYTNREEWERKTPNEPYPENIAEVIIAKHRNGPIGHVPLFFRNDVVRFESLEQPVRTREFA
jgi:hypothetical protein